MNVARGTIYESLGREALRRARADLERLQAEAERRGVETDAALAILLNIQLVAERQRELGGSL